MCKKGNAEAKRSRLCGLCLKSVCSIAISVPYCFASINSIEGKNLLHKRSWDAYASLKVNDSKNKKWYTDSKYNESIYNTMATAIADCMTRSNEFESTMKKTTYK